MYCLCKGENRGNIFLKNINVRIQNCMVTTEHHALKKFLYVCVCDICSEEKENILPLHFICSCHLDLGIVKVKKGHTEVGLVFKSFHLGTLILKVHFHNWNAF